MDKYYQEIWAAYLVPLFSVKFDPLDQAVLLDPQVDGAPGVGVEQPADECGQLAQVDVVEPVHVAQLRPQPVPRTQQVVSGERWLLWLWLCLV